MRFRLFLNLFLFIIVIGLALFLFNSKNGEQAKKEILLTGINPENINTIQISRKTGDIVFKKENNKWHMQSPYYLLANPVRINSMLRLLQAHSYTQINKKDVDLNQFKLNEPDVSIRFNTLQIDFGDTSPLNEQRYVMVNDTIHLINDSLYPQLKTSATFFLSNTLLQPGSEITAISFPDYSLRRNDGVWKLEPESEISGDDIIRMVEAWQKLEAVSIRPYEKGESSGTIKIEMKNHDPISFTIVSPPPQLILARPDLDIQYHISGYDSEQLFPEKSPAEKPPAND